MSTRRVDRAVDRAFAYCGLLGISLLFIGLLTAQLMPAPGPQKTAEENAAFYLGHSDAIVFGMFLSIIGATLCGPWLALMVKQVRKIDGPDSAAALCLLAFSALMVLEIILPFMMIITAVYRPDRPERVIQALTDQAQIIWIGLDYTFCVQIALVGIVVLKNRGQKIWPWWVGPFSMWSAVVSTSSCFIIFFHRGPWTWSGGFGFWMTMIVGGFWGVVMCFVVLHAAGREDDEDARTPTAAVPVAGGHR